MKNDIDEDLLLTLLESVHITRWNKDNTVLYSVLTVDEMYNIVDEIITNLKNNNYKIIKT